MARHASNLWHTSVLRDVDDYALWKGPLLQQPLLWVLTSAPEELGGLQPEGTKPLADAVDEGMGVPRSLLVVLGLEGLLLLLGAVQALLPLLLAPNYDVVEVALLQVLDDRVRREHRLEDLPEVVDEELLLLVVSALDRSPIRGDLLRLDGQLHELPVVLDGYAVGLVLRGVHEAMVLEGVPFLCAALAALGTVLPLPPAVDGLVVVLSLHQDLRWPCRRCGLLLHHAPLDHLPLRAHLRSWLLARLVLWLLVRLSIRLGSLILLVLLFLLVGFLLLVLLSLVLR
mmetsp:Transcript_36823/g.113454  ORF Transcript_36823/g.113454 Transcript_36823/m.113454 type:complete len:285 (+) Transcript_36823:1177-2031(+)